mmetsp:Transcript_15138/g.32868  ORF Transcript_15138/g.32868 Transcript_15138/m.32868 type:complete len:93 (+) Transcript_15138:897-1175(+)
MHHSWAGVVDVYRGYLKRRKQSQNDSDKQSKYLSSDPEQLSFGDGGTCFHIKTLDARILARDTPPTHTPTIICMSDGGTNDATDAARGNFLC